MQIHDLFPAPGSRKKKKRVGRGHGSGHGGRSGKGNNGQLSRSGGGKGPGFEGGQNPLHMRLPKLPGFKNRFRLEYSVVNVGRLEDHFSSGDVVDPATLHAAGVVKSSKTAIKILGDGEITKPLIIRVDKVSASAAEKIVAAGGKVESP
ncbi:MAG: 50S ribosomal protein L15 [Actinobacteria bacterium]|nr:50S ribosomal protein L15 [Actinomycetota bacterium]MCL5887169.1 50S ribosomal protein L15 [Actinomycetota bacterium]